MIVGHPPPANVNNPTTSTTTTTIRQPGAIDTVDFGQYGAGGFAAGPSLGWEWDEHIELPGDLSRSFDPSGELVEQLRDHAAAPVSTDFALPEPVAREKNAPGEPPPSTSTTTTNAQRSSAKGAGPVNGTVAVQSPAKMPVVLGGAGPSTRQRGTVDVPPSPSRPSTAQSTSSGTPVTLKRKSDPEATAQQQPPAKRISKGRSMSAASVTPAPTPERVPMATRSQSAVNAGHPALAVDIPAGGSPFSAGGLGPHSAATEVETRSPAVDRSGTTTAVAASFPAAGATSSAAVSSAATPKPRRIVETSSQFSNVLPAGKVFPIQIGSELFRLSGASISSDAPSYFSHFFSEQLINNSGKTATIRTLYIDRDPQTFRDISLHLQGYHVKPRDGEHYVRLFADAQFYSLPRLTQQLFKTDIYIRIGDRNFQIPRDIFSSPGNSPNFFSLGFAHFFSTPSEVFPGLDRTSLLRPPSIQSPSVPNRSAAVFEDLLHLLQGYPVNIRDEKHREELLRDARYFHLKGLEQRLIPCSVDFNLARQESEIVIRLEDIRQSGVSFHSDDGSRTSSQSQMSISACSGADSALTSEQSNATHSTRLAHISKVETPSSDSGSAGLASSTAASLARLVSMSGHVRYARPFVDDAPHALIVETSGLAATRIDLATMRATFTDQTKARIASLFSVVANKLGLSSLSSAVAASQQHQQQQTQPLASLMLSGGVPTSPSASGLSGDLVRVSIDRDTWCELDGGVIEWADDDNEAHHNEQADPSPAAHAKTGNDGADPDAAPRTSSSLLPRIRRWRRSSSGTVADNDDSHTRTLDVSRGEWVVHRAHWRLRVEPAAPDTAAEGPGSDAAAGTGAAGGGRPADIVLQAVKLQAWSGERCRNGARAFLG